MVRSAVVLALFIIIIVVVTVVADIPFFFRYHICSVFIWNNARDYCGWTGANIL